MMRDVDIQVGRLVTYLKDHQLYDNTLIVFTSDHGEHLGDHWQFAKYIYYDATFHIPLIIRDPTLPGGRGRCIEHFTEAVDVMPSILDCLDLPVPVACDGYSLKIFLVGDIPSKWRTEAHFELEFRHFSGNPSQPILGLTPDQCAFAVLRGKRYKYIHFTSLPALLFDLEKDPGEFDNLAQDPAHRETLASMVQRMLSWRMSHVDRCLANTRITPEGAIEQRPSRH